MIRPSYGILNDAGDKTDLGDFSSFSLGERKPVAALVKYGQSETSKFRG